MALSFPALASIAAAVVFAALLPCAEPRVKTYVTDDKDCCYVNKTLLWSKQIHGLDSESMKRLKPLLSYGFLLPPIHLRAGMSFYGSATRLRNFVDAMLNGSRPLKVGVVGGSISWGASASSIGMTDWFSLIAAWMTSVSTSPVSFRNGCVPATGSRYMALCLQNSVDEDVDLLFVEYTLNDGVEDHVLENRIVKNMERLVRRILTLPRRPALVMMQVPMLLNKVSEPFHHTSEDLEGALSAYYDIPTLSSRTVLHQLGSLYPNEPFSWHKMYRARHPGDSGHKAMADLVVHLIQSTAQDLVLNPLTDEERAHLTKPFPEPMYEGNEAPHKPVCAVGEAFKDKVTKAMGWEWKNEGTPDKPKWGYVATEAGAQLRLVLDTAQPHMYGHPKYNIAFYYLTSYTSMGRAQFECVKGCVCNPEVVDAHITRKVSQLALMGMMVTQAKECVVAITVLDETNSDGHKFKVAGVVL